MHYHESSTRAGRKPPRRPRGGVFFIKKPKKPKKKPTKKRGDLKKKKQKTDSCAQPCKYAWEATQGEAENSNGEILDADKADGQVTFRRGRLGKESRNIVVYDGKGGYFGCLSAGFVNCSPEMDGRSPHRNLGYKLLYYSRPTILEWGFTPGLPLEKLIISEAYDSTCKLRCVNKLISRHDVVVSSVLCMSRMASNAISVTGRPCELRYL